jgi:hypothetical protein
MGDQVSRDNEGKSIDEQIFAGELTGENIKTNFSKNSLKSLWSFLVHEMKFMNKQLF